MPESAREVIAARLAQNLPPRPDPFAFANEILRKDDEKYHRPHRSGGTVFYDRSAVEGLAMVHEASPLSEEQLNVHLAAHNFYRTVFVLPPWQAIYVNDTERDHTFTHAVAVHGQIVLWYTRCGYQINEVPCTEVEQRVNHVLQALANDA